jgi:TonB-dependent SusC/RagA subfamily outer membrane receptor
MKSKAYAFPPLILLTGLIWACASTNRTGADEVASAPLQPPSAAPSPYPSDKVVTAEDIQRTPGTSLDQAMSGRFPGVWITRASDGGLRIRIRGTTSIEGNQEPLYVLDGIALQSGPGGDLHGIVAADIATIEVLKDAIATSLYGVRGANGVIIIKTKPPPVN